MCVKSTRSRIEAVVEPTTTMLPTAIASCPKDTGHPDNHRNNEEPAHEQYRDSQPRVGEHREKTYGPRTNTRNGTLGIPNRRGDVVLFGICHRRHEKWDFLTGDEIQVTQAIVPDVSVYSGSDDTILDAVDSTGENHWQLDACGTRLCATVCLASTCRCRRTWLLTKLGGGVLLGICRIQNSPS